MAPAAPPRKPRGQELAPAEEEEEEEEEDSGRSWRPTGAPAQGRWDWTLAQPDQSLPFHAQMQLRRQPGAWWRADGGVAAIARLVLCGAPAGGGLLDRSNALALRHRPLTLCPPALGQLAALTHATRKLGARGAPDGPEALGTHTPPLLRVPGPITSAAERPSGRRGPLEDAAARRWD